MSRRWPALACALLAGAGLGVGNEITSGGTRRGFVVGLGDHIVLAPYGINAADPQAFAGDWFTREAPQPHWLFDVVVWAGRSAGQLPLALLLYYVVALAVFGAATALLALRWCGRTPAAAVASAAVGLLSSYQATYLAGTNTLNSPLALPNVLGGSLTYLYVAALLARRRWAPVVLPFAAAAHIQMGALALAVGALVWLADAWRGRTRPGLARRPLLVAAGWWLVGALVVVFGMRLRAVAADPAAFVEICDRYIGFHCSAQQWSRWQMLSTLGAVTLCMLATLRLRGRDRVAWALAVTVPAVGLLAAMMLDRKGVPVLGRMVQAYNAYRVGNLIFPFAVWGVLAPLLPWPARGGAAGRGRAGLLARGALVTLTAPAAVLFYTSPGTKTRFAVEPGLTPLGIASGVALVLVYAAAWLAQARLAGRMTGGPAAVRRARVGAISAAAVVVVALGGLTVVRVGGYPGAAPTSLRWPATEAEAVWGTAAREVVAPDVQVLINPNRPNLKLALERGVVVDCKDLPYGGAPYREWNRRLEALGGANQCESSTTAPYDALDAAALDRAAREFGARAIVVAHRDDGSGPTAGLTAMGYRAYRVAGTATGLDTDILVR